jgi:uncharacterized protein (TIGR03435 family)
VIAKAPPATRPDVVRQMLQTLLADRFHLVIKANRQPVPAYVLSVGNGQPKLKRASESGEAGCVRLRGEITDAIMHVGIQCRGVTLDDFLTVLRTRMNEQLSLVNATGLTGAWDFDLRYPLQGLASDAIIQAVDQQLGLKLERQKVPQPGLLVESVNEQPTPNSPGVATELPPLPPPEFEVASIRPCDRNAPLSPQTSRFQPGGRVNLICAPLASLIRQAWDVPPLADIAGAPKWLESDPAPFTILAKAPERTFADARGNAQYEDLLNAMLHTLIVDRFKMKFHYENRPMDAYTLVAIKPKLAKADPSNRTGCTRTEEPPQGRGNWYRLDCQNMTMAQLAEQLPNLDSSDVHYPVTESTGLDGAWDFAIRYNVVFSLAALPAFAAAGNGQAGGQASDPSDAGPTFLQAIEKQLGLKLEVHKRPVRVLVIDHIEEKPTEN